MYYQFQNIILKINQIFDYSVHFYMCSLTSGTLPGLFDIFKTSDKKYGSGHSQRQQCLKGQSVGWLGSIYLVVNTTFQPNRFFHESSFLFFCLHLPSESEEGWSPRISESHIPIWFGHISSTKKIGQILGLRKSYFAIGSRINLPKLTFISNSGNLNN